MSASKTIKILSGAAMRTFLTEIVPLFEQAKGAKVDIEYRLTSVLKKEIAEGIAFDIALLPRPEIDELTAAGRIGEGASADVARSTVGLCVRAGAPKPDIATVPAFKAALVAASTISYSDGPSGAYVGDLLGKLGLGEAMKGKTRLTSRPVAELVAAGEAEIGLQQIVAILPVKGADLVGPLPAELQNVIIYAAGLSAAGEANFNAKAARAFVAFTKTPQAGQIMRRKGLEPA
jgi:molybdate transport system substrate-binding protein